MRLFRGTFSMLLKTITKKYPKIIKITKLVQKLLKWLEFGHVRHYTKTYYFDCFNSSKDILVILEVFNGILSNWQFFFALQNLFCMPPNIRKCILEHFQECNKTLNDKLFSIKMFAPKNILCWKHFTTKQTQPKN